MKPHWTDLAIAAALVAAGCVAVYAGISRALRRAVAEREQSTQRQLQALAYSVMALQSRVAELGRQQLLSDHEGELASVSAATEGVPGEESRHVKPEMLAAITAAATAFLGKKARIRSTRLMPDAQERAGAWAQQGRVVVQTSHNLRTRG